MRVLSLFSGCGGLDLGFAQAGFDIVAASEWDETIYPTYKANHPDTMLIEGDVKNLTVYPEHIDGIIGGPPCQSWSEAGKQRGISDARGQLFYEYIRILKDVSPKFFVAENVYGMLWQKHQPAVRNILDKFDQAGYNVNIHVVNAQDYGLAQERKRIFFIGFRKDLDIMFQFPSPADRKLTMRDVIWDLQFSVVPTLPHHMHNPAAINNNEYYVDSYSPMFMSRNRVREWDTQSFTVQASGRQCQIHPSAPRMLKQGDTYIFQPGFTYRRLSVREAARLQGFPDDFYFIYDDADDGYKMIGNAVPVPLAYTIAQSIKGVFV